MTSSNLAKRARAAMGMSQADLAKLLGVKQQILSRWEKGAKMSAPAVTMMLLIEAGPDFARKVLGGARPGAAQGYAGDGGPPPQRAGGYTGGPMVDEHGFVLTAGERPEEDLGFAPAELDLPEADFEFDEDDPLAYRPTF